MTSRLQKAGLIASKVDTILEPQNNQGSEQCGLCNCLFVKERLLDRLRDYKAFDIYNIDETGLFFQDLPYKSLVVMGSDCAGGKKSKERLIVALCINAEREFEEPLVIRKSLKPHCLKKNDTKKLGVSWTATL